MCVCDNQNLGNVLKLFCIELKILVALRWLQSGDLKTNNLQWNPSSFYKISNHPIEHLLKNYFCQNGDFVNCKIKYFSK